MNNFAVYFTYKGNSRKMLCCYSSSMEDATATKASLLRHPAVATCVIEFRDAPPILTQF